MVFECEVKSFIDKKKFGELLKFFVKNAKLIKRDTQETHYFKGDHDLRIQKNRFHAKIVLKDGKVHDELRKELEVKTPKESFPDLEKLFSEMGYPTEIKWFRNRFEFGWEGITTCLDFTKGYGYIIELEKMCEDEKEAEQIKEILRKKLESLGVEITPREEFDKKFKEYKNNWKSFLKSQ